MKTKLIYFAAIAALTIAGCSKEGGGLTRSRRRPRP